MAIKQAPVVAKVSKPKKEKRVWTLDTAKSFISRSKIQGLTYWSAVDYLKKVHSIEMGSEVKKK